MKISIRKVRPDQKFLSRTDRCRRYRGGRCSRAPQFPVKSLNATTLFNFRRPLPKRSSFSVIDVAASFRGFLLIYPPCDLVFISATSTVFHPSARFLARNFENSFAYVCEIPRSWLPVTAYTSAN